MEAELYYKPKLLEAGEFKGAFERATAAVLGPNAEIEVSYPRSTGRAGVIDNITVDSESLRAPVDLSRVEFTLYATVKDRLKLISKRVSIHCSTLFGLFRMSAWGDESVDCLERLALNLGLERTELPAGQSVLEKLELRVSALEKSAKEVANALKCFISFKFDDARTVAAVDRLKRVLAAVHVEWVTGEQFEPRRIEDKVKAKLRADVDFVIAVISKAGESKWIRDELADANARDLWIIVLLEDGATFDRGIFGTLEYIPYDLAIDQAFPALLEGLNFMRAELSSKIAKSIEPRSNPA
jgi:hypothetical protein